MDDQQQMRACVCKFQPFSRPPPSQRMIHLQLLLLCPSHSSSFFFPVRAECLFCALTNWYIPCIHFLFIWMIIRFAVLYIGLFLFAGNFSPRNRRGSSVLVLRWKLLRIPASPVEVKTQINFISVIGKVLKEKNDVWCDDCGWIVFSTRLSHYLSRLPDSFWSPIKMGEECQGQGLAYFSMSCLDDGLLFLSSSSSLRLLPTKR